MGFKKTSEGRVYFKSPDNDDTPESTPKPAPKAAEKTKNTPITGKKSDGSQLQILSLLKTLNGKLKETQDDRDAVRKELEDYKAQISRLEKQVDTQKSDYIDLEDKVSRKQNEVSKKTTRVEDNVKKSLKELDDARAMVKDLEKQAATYDASLGKLREEIEKQRKKEAEILNAQTHLLGVQTRLEDKQKEQSEKMENQFSTYKDLTKRLGEAETRYDALENKIEESHSDYLKLDRKIDKVIEDRNRMLRKVERIEQAVLETRDALNAKAMVLLTDQGAVAGVDVPHIGDDTFRADPMAIGRRMQEESMMPWWRRPVRIQLTSLIIFAVLILMVGWVLSSVLRPNDMAQQATSTSKVSVPRVSLYDSTGYDDPARDQDTFEDTQTQFAEDVSPLQPEIRSLPEDTPEDTPQAVVAEGTSGMAFQDSERTEQIGDAESLSEAFERNSNAVAVTLNEIEPGNPNQPLDDAIEVAQAPVFPPDPPERIARKDGEFKSAAENRSSDDIIRGVVDQSTQVSQMIEEDVAQSQNALGVTDIEPAAGYTRKSLLRDIQPDPRLNDIAKRIETQALQGVPEAQHDMGALYVAGHGQVKRDLNRAVWWFNEAANNGVPNAIYNLGVLYHQGMGVDKSLEKAISLYRRAASLGHAEAQYNLGIANIEGIGVPYNPGRAARFFESAALKGVVESAYNLGLIYENGLLGETRPDEALLWYKRAADAGSPEAQAALQQLVLSLGIQMDDVAGIVSAVENKSQARYQAVETGENARGETRAELISQIQQELKRRGLYAGDVDGIIGPNTRNSIRAFQEAANLSVTGEPSETLLQMLKASL